MLAQFTSQTEIVQTRHVSQRKKPCLPVPFHTELFPTSWYVRLISVALTFNLQHLILLMAVGAHSSD